MGNLATWERGRGAGAVTSGAVLIDCSTYYSARSLLLEGDVNAYTVFNLANLLECVVIADGVLLSPTVSWAPSREDTLFGKYGVCTKLDVTTWDEPTLSRLFVNALSASISDVASSSIRGMLGYERASTKPAIKLLTSWQNAAITAPHEFLNQYSGAVHLTDSASKRFVSELHTATSSSASSEYHLAQYLLRSNVAYELSATWAYHPHSHRLNYIADRMHRARRESAGLGHTLLQATERLTAAEISSLQRNTILRSLGAFKHEVQLPLILSAVLSQADHKDEVLPITIELRNHRNARRYRHWLGKMISAIDSCNLSKQIQAEAELREAWMTLSKDLSKLYQPTHGASEIFGRTAAYAGTFDPSIITALSTGMAAGEVAMKGAVAIAEIVPPIAEWLRQHRRRRNMVFLLDLSRKRQRVESLNPLLSSVFGKTLDQEELNRLYAIRAEQFQAGSIITGAESA